MTDLDDTIAAPASAPGPGLRAIVRVTGPQTHAVVGRCFQADDLNEWLAARTPRRHVGRIDLPGWRTPIHSSVLLWPFPRSYTGSPSAELHLPGSPPLVAAVLRCLYSAGARAARAGEFTLRAFLAGRLDLTQAEAVLGVIDAEDHAQLRQALEQLAGGLAGKIAALREQLLLHLSDLEAGLDFADEDLDFVHRDQLRLRLEEATRWLAELQAQAQHRLQSTGRRHVVLAGLPNAGKSTLFNALAGQSVAIVSPQRGTTRDVLSIDLDIGGHAITLWDTAGWEEALYPVDQSAAALRCDRLDRADLIVWCTAADADAGERQQDQALFATLGRRTTQFRIRTKHDLAVASMASRGHMTSGASHDPEVSLSAGDAAGLQALQAAIARRLAETSATAGELLGSTAARCGAALEQAQHALANAAAALDAGRGDELIALDLRAGLEALGAICGAVYTDDILDRIFSRFCIGK